MSQEYKNLNNPPIENVIIGFQLDNLFSSNEEIDMFMVDSKLTEKYPQKQDLESVAFEVSDNPKIIKNNLKAIQLSTDDSLENIHIENNKIIYSDKTKYEKFEVFYNKVEYILNNIINCFGEELVVSEIGLRYINRFSLPVDKLASYFKIFPTIDCNQYAAIKNYLAISNIVSTSNQSIEASTKTIYSPVATNKLEVIFDIDTYYKDTFKLKDLNDLQNRLKELKDFKNDIFYNNFIDINNMEDFK